MERPEGDVRVPEATPNVARAFDVAVGGSDHFEIDRQFMDEVRTIFPAIDEFCRHQWTFSRGVAAHFAAAGLDQFLVLGSGLPTVDPVHAVAARHVHSRPHVVYVDRDAVTVAHARRLLADDDRARTAAIRVDVSDSDALLADPELRAVLDLSRPLAVVAVGVLEFMDDDAASALVARLQGETTPGSALALTIPTVENREDYRGWVRHEHTGFSYGPLLRSPGTVDRWLEGWHVPAPGWCSAPHWEPGAERVPGADEAATAQWGVVAWRSRDGSSSS